MIVFGNEDREGWVKFWEFAKRVHPRLNTPETIIITDQDKGSIEAMEEVLPHAVNFFCSFYQRKNIQTYVKGGKSKYSCLWFYQLLLNSKNHVTIRKHRFEHSAHIDAKALHYLNLVNDH